MRATRPNTMVPVPGRALPGVLTVATMLSGCASAPGGHDGHDGPAPMVGTAEIVDGYDCLAPNLGFWALPPDPAGSSDPQHPDAPAAGRVPAGFTPTTAVRCEQAPSIEDAEGRWSAVAAVTLAGDLTPLLEALAEPDDLAWPGPCTADMELVAPLWLVDAGGRALLAHYPRDKCAKTKPGVHRALAGLSVRETTTRKRTLDTPRAALDSGCATAWAAPFPVETPQPVPPTDSWSGVVGASPAGPSPVADAVLADVDGMHWCRYVVEAVSTAAVEPGEGAGAATAATFRSGRFVAGGTLDAAMSRSVAGAAASDAVSQPCDDPATMFVALWPTVGGLEVGTPLMVDLDGCELLSSPGRGARPLPPDVLDQLTLRTAG